MTEFLKREMKHNRCNSSEKTGDVACRGKSSCLCTGHIVEYCSSILTEASHAHVKTIRELYPTLSEQELKEAETNLLRYFEIALDVYEEHDVDTSPDFPTMKERSKSLKN